MRVHFHSFRARALLACVPATAMVLMGAAGTASAAHRPANSRAELRTALEHLPAGWHPGNHGAHWATFRGTGLKQVTRSNWSGYADDNSSGNHYASVSGKWKEPTVTNCSTTGPAKAVIFWVGIDGFTSHTVEQGGTGAFCGHGAPLTYFTWWEMAPNGFLQMVGTTVKPGDSIAASVVPTGTSYKISVTDSTTAGNSFSTTQPCGGAACTNTSAEWIAGAQGAGAGEVPLPNFSPWTLTHATVKSGTTSGTISTFPDDAITMEFTSPDNDVKPGPLNATGNSFKDSQLAT
jgi:hypothetical protein